MKALIAGAGIGGLTAALFLEKAGIEVELFERAAEVREIGVGINMLPHAVKELAGLGLMADLDGEGIRTRELVYANRLGQVIWRELRGIDAGYDVPQISIHRGRLLGLIHRAVLSRLGPDVFHTGCSVTGFEERPAGVTVRFEREDGSSGEAVGDLLIGADGIHSAVRASLYPDEGPPIWSGIMLWRGTVDWPVWQDGRTMAIAGGNFAMENLNVPLGSYKFDKPTASSLDGVLGVRPEHIAVGEDAKKMPFQLESEIEIVEPMGAETVAYTKVGGQALTLRCSSDIPLEAGQKIMIGFDPARGSVFDAQSGARL